MKSKALVPVSQAENQANQITSLVRAHGEWLTVTAIEPGEQFTSCSAAMSVVAQFRKQGKEQLESFLVDPKNTIKKIKAVFEPAISAAEKIEGKCKLLLSECRDRVEAEALRNAEKEAKRAEKKGATQLASDIRENASAIALGTMQTSGAQFRSIRKAIVKDLRTLCAAVATGEVEPELVDPCMSKLNALARATENGSRIPGVEFINETVVAAVAL